VFWTISTIKDEKSAAKFHYVKTVSGEVVAQSIAFRVVSVYWQGVAPFPWYLNAKGPTPIGSTFVAHTSPQRGSRDVIASLACVRFTGWPVAWNWRRAVLSADAGLLVMKWSKRWWAGIGISWIIKLCESYAPHSIEITTPAPHHYILLQTRCSSFLTPNQQCQSTYLLTYLLTYIVNGLEWPVHGGFLCMNLCERMQLSR